MKDIRPLYDKFGSDNFYEMYGNEYQNPKEQTVANLVNFAKNNWNIGTSVLDMCCGSGEVTKEIIKSDREKYNIIGLDPYTCNLYEKTTGKECIQMDFDGILSGKLLTKFDTIICSFALHLCEESKLPKVLWQLSFLCNNLIIISPHKRPDCEGISFRLIDSEKQNRCTMKLYKSKNFLK